MRNALSVDLESFVHRQLDTKKRTFSDDEYTVVATKYLLNLFEKYNTKVTFFVLGEIYEWYPKLIDEIKNRGHEIGYHGHRHIILKNEKTLLDELGRSEEFLKKYKPVGFRAPRMFLKKEYLKILENAGFKYDSSVYGSQIRKIKEHDIKEIPVSFFSYFPVRDSVVYPQNIKPKLFLKGIPFGSGFFLSIMRKRTKYFIEKVNKNGQSAVLFIHPWQFYDYQKDFSKSIPRIQKFIYKRKLNNVLEYLLRNNKFYPLKDLL